MPLLGTAKKVADFLLRRKPATSGYKSWPQYWGAAARDLPLFSFLWVRLMLRDPTVRLGLQMRAAPLCGAEFAYQDGGEWIPGVKADNPDVAEFVHRQLQRIWKYDLDKILSAQSWGWSAGEVMFRLVDGMIEFDELLDRAAMDSRALLREGKVCGVQFERIEGEGKVRLGFPKCWFHGFNPEGGSPYGMPILYGAFSPWWDLWMEGGALDVMRLFAHKDAYGGIDIAYPGGTTTDHNGNQIPNQDIARQMAEQIKAGGVTTRPYDEGQSGKNRWEITRATVPANPSHIYSYPDKLEVRILRGMGIPDDVLTSSEGSSGAWAGKQVPQSSFHTGLEMWLHQVVKCVVQQIIEPLVMLNWGRAEDFEVCTKPLAQQVQEHQKPPQGGQASAEDGGGGAGWTPFQGPRGGSGWRNGNGAVTYREPSRLSLDGADHTADLAAGQIVGAAENIVRAARAAIKRRGGAQRMSMARAPKGGVTIDGTEYKGGEFVPGKTQAEVDKAGGKPAMDDYSDYVSHMNRIGEIPLSRKYLERKRAERLKAVEKSTEPPAETIPEPSNPKKRIGKDGTEWVRAKKGGEISPVTGDYFKGGQWMPVHGLSPKQDKTVPKKKTKASGATPPKPNEDGKGRELRPPMSPEQIAELRERREAEEKWNKIKEGPVGKLLFLGERPHYIRKTDVGIKNWQKMIADVGLSNSDLGKLVDHLEPLVLLDTEKEFESGWDEGAHGKKPTLEQFRKEQVEYEKELASMGEAYWTKKSLKEFPAGPYASHLLSRYLEKDQVERIGEMNEFISGLGMSRD